ncbi:MAG: hypothetical protein PWQ77_432 [Kosmotogales bacterium]|nr:hypothetical protein [Kosmotogales bacterium]
MLNKWRGIYPAMVTPFNEDESIDKKSLVNLVNFLEEGGVRGIYALGTTGEFPHLTSQERYDVIEIVSKTSKNMNVIANIGDITTKKTIENAKLLEKIDGVDAVAVVSPYYYILNQEQITEHHLKVGKNINFPFFLYYIPQMTKLPISMKSLEKIASLPNFVGLKDSSHDISWYGEAKDIIEGKVYLTGSDALIYHFLNAGSSGAVAATACASPKLLSDLMKAYDSGDIKKAIELQKIVCSLRKLIKMFPSLSGFKALLEYQGICKRYMRSPLTSVTDKQMEEIDEYLSKDTDLAAYVRRN